VRSIGTALHLSAERLRLSAGIEVQHVPFKSAPELATEVLTGRIDFAYLPVSLAAEQITAGKLQALAVSSPARASSLPSIPTTLELGLGKSDYNFWLGVFIPTKTPVAIIGRIHEAIGQALDTASVKEKLINVGVDPMPMSAERFQSFVRQEIATMGELARAARFSAK